MAAGTANVRHTFLSRCRMGAAPDLEGRILEADHAALRELAKRTGGRAVYLDQLDDLIHSIESRSQPIPDDRTWPIWDTKLALLLLTLLLVTEWIARKAYNLT